MRAGLLLASLSLVMAQSAAASNATAATSITLRVLVIPLTRSFDDVPPKTHGTTGQYTKGDTLRGTSILRNAVRQLGKPKGARIGASSFVFTALSSQKATFDSVAKVPGGTLHSHGVVKLEGNPTVPIVGGTGRYARATGVVEGLVLADGQQLDIIRVQIS